MTNIDEYLLLIENYFNSINNYILHDNPLYYLSISAFLFLILLNITWWFYYSLGKREADEFIGALIISVLALILSALWYFIACAVLGLITITVVWFIITLPARLIYWISLLRKYEIRKIK